MLYHRFYTNLVSVIQPEDCCFVQSHDYSGAQKNGRPTKNVRFCFLTRDFN